MALARAKARKHETDRPCLIFAGKLYFCSVLFCMHQTCMRSTIEQILKFEPSDNIVEEALA